jgi:hypothetical protein
VSDPAPEQVCAECGRATPLVHGRCPNCGAICDASQLPATRPIPQSQIWGDVDDLIVVGGPFVLAVAVAALTLAGVLPGAAAIAVAVLLAAAGAARALRQ